MPTQLKKITVQKKAEKVSYLITIEGQIFDLTEQQAQELYEQLGPALGHPSATDQNANFKKLEKEFRKILDEQKKKRENGPFQPYVAPPYVPPIDPWFPSPQYPQGPPIWCGDSTRDTTSGL